MKKSWTAHIFETTYNWMVRKGQRPLMLLKARRGHVVKKLEAVDEQKRAY